ncbi:MAG: hypothetical protein DMF81_22550, partial [Acidobacteria bacterium]
RWTIGRIASRGWNLVETMGGGGGFVDYDRDGLLDIYLVSYTLEPQADGRVPRDALYHNNGDGTFTDVTARAGLGGPMRGMGLAVGDYDNDGWPDLYVSGYRSHHLYHKNRDGTFTDVTAAALPAETGWGTSAAFFDYDGDGDLDLFVCHYLDFDPEGALPCQMIGELAQRPLPQRRRALHRGRSGGRGGPRGRQRARRGGGRPRRRRPHRPLPGQRHRPELPLPQPRRRHVLRGGAGGRRRLRPRGAGAGRDGGRRRRL